LIIGLLSHLGDYLPHCGKFPVRQIEKSASGRGRQDFTLSRFIWPKEASKETYHPD
jgi:hypothetical protein